MTSPPLVAKILQDVSEVGEALKNGIFQEYFLNKSGEGVPKLLLTL